MKHPGLGGVVVIVMACLTSAGLAVMAAGVRGVDHREGRGMSQAHTFACGYVYGQRGIIRAAQLRVLPPEPGEDCRPPRDNALAHGFGSAKED